MRIVLPLLLLLLLSANALGQPKFREETERVLPSTLDLYRWFHAHPELSLEEKETSKRLARELEDIGLEVTENVGGHGVLGVLRGQAGGPVVLYRADMDGLPLQEKTGLPYSSQKQGVMHACGHDIHMSCAVAVLRLLASSKEQWNGTVLFVGQPAEEVGSGAESVIADPKFRSVVKRIGKPQMAIALHDDAEMLTGRAALTPGFVTANVDSVDITVFGRGGHGAIPSQSVDPIVIGSEIVMALQTIVSRRLEAGTRAVVTVGVFQAGTKRNIIPTQANLKLTIRSYKDETRTKIVEEIERISSSIAAAHGAPQPPRIKHYSETYTPAGFNNLELVEQLSPIFKKQLGENNLIELAPSMVGEDFSEYSRRLGIPSVMFLVGTANSETAAHPLHSSRFAPDAEPALRVSIPLMTAAIRELLRTKN